MNFRHRLLAALLSSLTAISVALSSGENVDVPATPDPGPSASTSAAVTGR